MENSKLTSLLWSISSYITLALILFVVAGQWLFIEWVVVSGLAIVGWLKFSYRQMPSQNYIVPVYVISILALLILDTIRYSSGLSGFIKSYYQHFFQTGFIINHTNWFILMVCLPVSIMLLGGYFLSKRTTIGFFFAWWGFVFCAVEAIIQFKIELGNISTYSHQ